MLLLEPIAPSYRLETSTHRPPRTVQPPP
eukprot:COSAG02_NODE_49285_length_327_cov_12.780702_1_plen_28_part_10